MIKHNATYTTNRSMPSILRNGGYAVLNMGRGWKNNRQFENLQTGNTFYGEPESFNDTTHVYGYDNLAWDIVYSFKGRRHNNYGENNLPMDRLYYILVNKCNEGVDFIAYYLRNVAPALLEDEIRGTIEPVIAAYQEEVLDNAIRAEEIIAENIAEANTNIAKSTGTFKKSTRAGRKIVKAQVVLDDFLAEMNSPYLKGMDWEEVSEDLANKLRLNFISAMQTGQVPLTKDTLSNATTQKRIRLGLPPNPRFVATGDFVNSIDFKIRIYET